MIKQKLVYTHPAALKNTKKKYLEAFPVSNPLNFPSPHA